MQVWARYFNRLLTRLDQARIDVSSPLTLDRHATGQTIRMPQWKNQQPNNSVSGFFTVIVNPNGGADGNSTTFATWTYDLFLQSDTMQMNKLNTSGALNPLCSRARINQCSVTPAGSGSVASAFYNTTGKIQLWDVQEVQPQTNC